MTDAAPATAAAPRAKRPRLTFMLHTPGTFEALGKFQSSDARYAALKCASRGHKDILLRQTNTRLVYQYEGQIIDLETPKEVFRGDKTKPILYHKKPAVKFVKKFLYTGDAAIKDEEEATA